MEKIREQIREILSEAEHPALLWSGGKDSQLLLHLCLEVGDGLPLIWFHPFSTPKQERFARRIIREYNLTVWSWMPSDIYLLPDNDGLTLCYEQSFGTHTLPGLVDITDGEKCIFDFYNTLRTPSLFPHWDALLIGLKDSDSHSITGSHVIPDEWHLGKARVYAPLRCLTDAEVWQAIRELNVEVDEERYAQEGNGTDEIQACSACLQQGVGEVFCPKEKRAIPRVAWDGQASLSAFRQRFHFREAA